MNVREIVANNIIYYRLKKDWSQEDLAENLGTTFVYVSSLENAKRNIRIDYIDHIANTLGIEVKQLFEVREKIVNKKRKKRSNVIQKFDQKPNKNKTDSKEKELVHS